MKKLIPIIDIFSGPGGLGEGFTAFGKHAGKRRHFKIGLSVEKEKTAHATLTLRSFFRKFKEGSVPEEYYEVLRGALSSEKLRYSHKSEYEEAANEAVNATLGTGGDFNSQLDERIIRALAGEDKWVLIGGPPCQAYSVIGRARTNRENDEKNYLYLEYLRIIARHHPAVFVMENVKGILSSTVSGQKIFKQILTDLETPSYGALKGPRYRIFSLVKDIDDGKDHNDLKPSDFVVECEKYGIPQARHRVILLGIREDLCYQKPALLEPKPIVPIEAVLNGLPRLRSGLSKEPDAPWLWRSILRNSVSADWINAVRDEAGHALAEKITSILRKIKCPLENRGEEFLIQPVSTRSDLTWWYSDPNIGGVCNHTTRGHMREDIYRYIYASAFANHFGRSPKLSEFPSALQPHHKNVATGHFNDRFRVQVYGRPSTTITSHISKDGHYFIHPDPTQCRSLTVREAARIQTFPDNYFFCGNRTQQYVQVGNAVPPLLAYQIAEVVYGILKKRND